MALIATLFYASHTREYNMDNTSIEMLDAYSNITLFDFEFRSIGGNRPVPVCMVTKDARRASTYAPAVPYGSR